VRIRSPVLDLPNDFDVSVPDSTTVLDLKEHLSRDPLMESLQASDMHLIYQGRVLNDDQPLAALLKVRE
jgi:hypothetical protein